MGFTQIIEVETTRIDEMQALLDQWEKDTAARLPNIRGQLSQDRDRKNTYIVIAEFESYDIAMKNSNDPQTQHYSEQMNKLASKPPTFRNLDQLQTWQ